MTTLDTGTEDLRAEIDDGVAVITMNRPNRRNAFSPAIVSALGTVLARVETDGAVGCVVLTGDYGGTWFLTQLVGSSKAKELYYFSERLSAGDAERLGIVNAVCPAADFDREVMARARRLAQGPSNAYRYMKENLNRAVTGELADCMDMEVTHHVHTGLTEDLREAAQAFMDKREPRFHGR